ncbi:hypothetical protein ACFWU3_12535 [Streptomyces sp. NPDC058685]|uniref:hypothetical protein n=1 Tax=Streptomyces sp. NPDC058685 TaxID=3346598 RepID=UPI003655D4AA
MGRTGTTRRRALMATGAAAAAVLTGCSDGPTAETRTSGPAADPARAEKALRRRLAAASGSLRDHYDATITQHPALTARLTPLRTAVAAHVAALGGTPPVALAAPVPTVPAEALASLASAEKRACEAHTVALDEAPPELARLLASVAAAGATHVYLLTNGAAR